MTIRKNSVLGHWPIRLWNSPVKVSVDPVLNAAYVSFAPDGTPIKRTKMQLVHIDYDENDIIVGIELL